MQADVYNIAMGTRPVSRLESIESAYEESIIQELWKKRVELQMQNRYVHKYYTESIKKKKKKSIKICNVQKDRDFFNIITNKSDG